MTGRSVNPTTLFLGRLRPPKRLTSTSCTYFRQYLTTALLEKAEGETKVCCHRVSNPRPLTYESGALPIVLRGPACVWANSADPQCVVLLGPYSICNSIHNFWTHNCTVKPKAWYNLCHIPPPPTHTHTHSPTHTNISDFFNLCFVDFLSPFMSAETCM